MCSHHNLSQGAKLASVCAREIYKSGRCRTQDGEKVLVNLNSPDRHATADQLDNPSPTTALSPSATSLRLYNPDCVSNSGPACRNIVTGLITACRCLVSAPRLGNAATAGRHLERASVSVITADISVWGFGGARLGSLGGGDN